MATDQNHWYPVLEAAARLSVSENALRKRIRRDTIEWTKDEDGRIVVRLEEASTDQAEDQSGDQAADQAEDQATGQSTDQALLVESLQDQVHYLREQLDTIQAQSAERDRENRRIIAALTQRVPELPAPPDTPREPRQSPVAGAEPRSDTQAPQEEERRSWWQKLFGTG